MNNNVDSMTFFNYTPPNQQHDLANFYQCSICYSDSCEYVEKGFAQNNNINVQLCSINDVEYWPNDIMHIVYELDKNEKRLKDTIILNGPCFNKKHTVCVGCLRRSILLYHQFMKPQRSTFTFTWPVNDITCCCNIGNMYHYLKYLFTNSELCTIINEQQSTSSNQYEYIKCPNIITHIIDTFTRIDDKSIQLHQNQKCNNIISVPKKYIMNSRIGNVLIVCSNPMCNARFCYHCLKDGFSYDKTFNMITRMTCKYCALSNNKEELFDVRSNSKSGIDRFNFFFRKLEKHDVRALQYLPKSVSDYFYRNSELHLTMVLKHIKHILDMDILRLVCPICAVTIEKTADCNLIKHCNVEMCYVCTMSTLPDEKIPITHWSEPQNNYKKKSMQQFQKNDQKKIYLPNKCPRWDDDTTWTIERKNCFLSHKTTEKIRQKKRKYFAIREIIKSLNLSLRQQIRESILNESIFSTKQTHDLVNILNC